MTFLEAALKILSREGKPLHFKDLTDRAMTKKLLTFVGRTPEVTMQTQLTAAVKKAPGNPFVRVKPGVFGLLRYPELPPEEPEAEPAKADKGDKADKSDKTADKSGDARPSEGGDGRGRRRRRRGGRGRGRDEATASGSGAEAPGAANDSDSDNDDGAEEPAVAGLSAAARAAALAATGVLEGDDDEAADEGSEEGSEEGSDEAAADSEGDDMSQGHTHAAAADGGAAELGDRAPASTDGSNDAHDGDDEGDEEEGGEEAGAAGDDAAARGPGAEGGAGELGAGRRRRRRRRRRGGEGSVEGGPRPSEGADGTLASRPASEASGGEGASASEGPRPDAEGAPEVEAQGPRRIMTPVDAALEILRGQAPGRGVAVRQIADAAVRRRLVHGEPNEAWRVMRAGLASESRERLRAGQRPRVRPAGAGLFALARRPPDAEVERAELVFGEARRALRERTIAALERRIAELPAPAFEALARVLLQREGFGPATFVKRVEGTIYVEALRGRGSRPSKALVALRGGGSSAGRRAIGELRAGIRARNQEEGLLMLGGRLADDAIAEWKMEGQPIEIADGQAMAETCVRHGLGVINANVSVDFVDADFFAELAEG
jgi:hypothetical protein